MWIKCFTGSVEKTNEFLDGHLTRQKLQNIRLTQNFECEILSGKGKKGD